MQFIPVERMTNQTRHIQQKYDFIRYQINARINSLVLIPGTDNPADVVCFIQKIIVRMLHPVESPTLPRYITVQGGTKGRFKMSGAR
jgi:hypothetical protein